MALIKVALMTAFVLVHGAWHGGWCWKKVTPLLRAAGHEVYTPTLTGLGERIHLASPEVDLTTHIQDVVNVLEYEDLREVVLVGHSYGGEVITGVADRLAPRLAHLVYFDAEVPVDGEALFDRHRDGAVAAKERARTGGDGWRIPVPAEDIVIAWADADNLPWLMRHLTPQPIKTWSQPIRLTNSARTAIPGTFIHCGDHPTPPLPLHLQRAQDAGWRFRELATGHDAMVTMPRELADLFLEVV
jgi:pimeloyl-ACP methyl ester carboxylesterase